MKTLAWAILIAVFTYWLAIEPAKRSAIADVKQAAAQGDSSRAQQGQPSQYMYPTEQAQLLTAAAKSRGLPRRVSDAITLISVDQQDAKVVGTYVFDRPASMPIPSDMIEAAKIEIRTNFRRSEACTDQRQRAALINGVSYLQHYFLEGGARPAFSIELRNNDCSL